MCHQETTDQKASHLLPNLPPLPKPHWDEQILNGDLNSKIVHPHSPKPAPSHHWFFFLFPPPLPAQNHKEPPHQQGWRDLRRGSMKWWRTGEAGKWLIAKRLGMKLEAASPTCPRSPTRWRRDLHSSGWSSAIPASKHKQERWLDRTAEAKKVHFY